MQEFLQTLHEQYREPYGSWHTRECYPWEYDVKIQECVNLANKSDWFGQRSESHDWFLQQAKILQDRANHIRHEWTKQETAKQEITTREALQVKQVATQKALQAAQTVSLTPQAPQASQSDLPPPIKQQSNSPAKKKRNQKTRKQKTARAQRVTIQVQEVDQVKEVESHVQEMEHSAPRSVNMESGKHVVLQRTMVPWVHRCWHAAAIQSDWMMSGMIMVGCGPNRMRRLGVG